MVAELTVALDAQGLRRLRTLEKASRPMAAKALTFTAERAVPAWVAGHSVFYKRRSWIDRGVRKTAATASNLNARVGSVDLYMGRHVKGVGQRKEPASSRLLVPDYARISEVKTHTQERRKIARAEGTKRKPFVMEARSGHLMLVRRKTKARAPLVIMGHLMRDVDIRPQLDALGIVEGVVHREFGPIYERLLLQWAAKV